MRVERQLVMWLVACAVLGTGSYSAGQGQLCQQKCKKDVVMWHMGGTGSFCFHYDKDSMGNQLKNAHFLWCFDDDGVLTEQVPIQKFPRSSGTGTNGCPQDPGPYAIAATCTNLQPSITERKRFCAPPPPPPPPPGTSPGT